jgi:hypothetical protein
MQDVTSEIQRVINYSDFHVVISGLISDSGPRFKNIIDESENYKDIREQITEHIQKDFANIEERTKSYKNCRDIHQFDQTFSFEDFKAKSNHDLEEVKKQFDQL